MTAPTQEPAMAIAKVGSCEPSVKMDAGKVEI